MYMGLSGVHGNVNAHTCFYLPVGRKIVPDTIEGYLGILKFVGMLEFSLTTLEHRQHDVDADECIADCIGLYSAAPELLAIPVLRLINYDALVCRASYC